MTTGEVLVEKIKESLSSVLPISVIVLLLTFIVVPVDSGLLLAYLTGTVLLILGMGFFTLGADISMTPMGQHVGSSVVKKRKLWLIILVSFLVGTLVTISEPDLQVLAKQLNGSINSTLLIVAVGIGVGLFLIIAMLRIVFKIRLSYILIAGYAIIFILAIFAPQEFIPAAFDAGGVTTGPMTVPFIMALGVGVASIRSDKAAEEDSFGLVALCSIGPILTVIILSIITKANAVYTPYEMPKIDNSQELAVSILKQFPEYFKEVAIALLPILIFFIIYQFIVSKIQKKALNKIVAGAIYTYLGLVLFLTGANAGFMPVGYYIGTQLGNLPYSWIIVPIGMLTGFFIVRAEPAVHVLSVQVENITSGSITRKHILLSLELGVSAAVGMAMIRVFTGISLLWFIVPIYVIALVLTFISPKIFTSIAFDSGGVASGPMTAAFLLPFASGACESLENSVITDAFGLIALVAGAPLLTIQILGLIFKIKSSKAHVAEETVQPEKTEEVENETLVM
ncbi:MAG: DUF1538 domain-containing protein [Clostridiales bacterium]|nr:DUF1538 domain-containing protein [Clostridiales bacterium]